MDRGAGLLIAMCGEDSLWLLQKGNSTLVVLQYSAISAWQLIHPRYIDRDLSSLHAATDSFFGSGLAGVDLLFYLGRGTHKHVFS